MICLILLGLYFILLNIGNIMWVLSTPIVHIMGGQ
jgi:hypothetical protein